jgi:hypothetical protein
MHRVYMQHRHFLYPSKSTGRWQLHPYSCCLHCWVRLALSSPQRHLNNFPRDEILNGKTLDRNSHCFAQYTISSTELICTSPSGNVDFHWHVTYPVLVSYLSPTHKAQASAQLLDSWPVAKMRSPNVMFSHTIKGQPYNMPPLARFPNTSYTFPTCYVCVFFSVSRPFYSPHARRSAEESTAHWFDDPLTRVFSQTGSFHHWFDWVSGSFLPLASNGDWYIYTFC